MKRLVETMVNALNTFLMISPAEKFFLLVGLGLLSFNLFVIVCIILRFTFLPEIVNTFPNMFP